ncbi:MAG: BON domain-containing protein [Desulfovibrio sp.]|nr:BON domain-containing protein [Desulfovibrio sp.]
MHKYKVSSFLFLQICTAICFLINGCAYGIIDDKRLIDTMSSDKSLATSIKTALMNANLSEGFSVSVYSYYQHVFLVGQVPSFHRDKVVAIAESKKPRSVTPHWFSKKKSSESDFMLSSKLRAALISAKGLSSTRVDTEVNAGRVVLLGVVGTEEEKKIAIRTARGVEGVREVTSYLMLPPYSEAENTPPKAETFSGLHPSSKGEKNSSPKTSTNPGGGNKSAPVKERVI